MTVDILTSDSLPHPDILPLYSYPKLLQFDRPFFWTLRDDLYRFSIAADGLAQATSLDGGAEGVPTIFRPIPLALVVRAAPMRLCHLHFLRDPYVVACGTSGSAHVLLIGRRDDPADPQPGADLVLGHGPHMPLGIELYKNKPIFYGVGSFSFKTGHRGRQHPDWIGLMVTLTLEDAALTRVAVSFVRHNAQNETVLRPVAAEREALDTLRRLSAPFATALDGAGDEVVVGATP
jgi:hypothetical protein